MNILIKKLKKAIYGKKKFIILCAIFLGIYIIVICPKSYNSFSRKAKLDEVDEIEISFNYYSGDVHEAVITEEYCNAYLINNKETINDIQKVLRSVSMRPKYNYNGTVEEGLCWIIKFVGQDDYDLKLWNCLNQNGEFYIYVDILDKAHNVSADDKYILPNYYKITKEENEKIIQILFQALQDNLKYMTAEEALQFSEENAEWREFKYYYAIKQKIWGKNAVRIPIRNTDMEIEIYYGRSYSDTGYTEPIQSAVIYDGEGKEYEYFSEEGREILRKEVEKY